MVQFVQASLLVLAVAAGASCQYYDFISALQPLLQYTTTKQQLYEYTTRRPNVFNTNGDSRTRIQNERHKQNYSSNGDTHNPVEILYEYTTRSTTGIYDAIEYEQTTKRTTTIRRTTTNNSNRRNIQQSNERNVIKNKDRNTNPIIHFIEENDSRNTKRQNVANNNDKIIYQDGKINTVYNYETTKSYTTKSPFIFEDGYQASNGNFVTQSPAPGVRPAVTYGVPITNRPVTQRPYSKPSDSDDTSVTPELIFGPNEEYMSNVDKKRYIELAERMCDKYKALNIKQVEAIPLLPSPNSVKVNVSSCTPSNVPLVVGGKVVTIREFPHMALLGWKKLHASGYAWKCGGSLISNQYVLTAGHCAYQDRDNAILPGPPRAVQLGSSYLNDHNAVVVKVAAVYRHPKYKQPKSYYDIAVVKLVSHVTVPKEYKTYIEYKKFANHWSPFLSLLRLMVVLKNDSIETDKVEALRQGKFSDNIKPACMGVPPDVGEPVIATGWGRTEFGGDQSNELRSVSIPVWDMRECYDVLGTSRKIPDGPSSDSQMCAGEKQGGKDTCQGDSGGPAQIQDGCIWRVTAVTSLGRSCGAPHTPALYALVPRAFVAAIAFNPNENKEKEQKVTNTENYQPTNTNYNTESNIQRNNQNINDDNQQTYNVNYNGDLNYESSSSNTQYSYNNYNFQSNQRPSYETSNTYNNNYNNRRNNYNDYTTRSYYVQEINYNNPPRNENYGVQSAQYYKR